MKLYCIGWCVPMETWNTSKSVLVSKLDASKMHLIFNLCLCYLLSQPTVKCHNNTTFLRQLRKLPQGRGVLSMQPGEGTVTQPMTSLLALSLAGPIAWQSEPSPP